MGQRCRRLAPPPPAVSSTMANRVTVAVSSCDRAAAAHLSPSSRQHAPTGSRRTWRFGSVGVADLELGHSLQRAAGDELRDVVDPLRLKAWSVHGHQLAGAERHRTVVPVQLTRPKARSLAPRDPGHARTHPNVQDGDRDHSCTAAGESAESSRRRIVHWEVAVPEFGHEPLYTRVRLRRLAYGLVAGVLRGSSPPRPAR